MAAWAGRSLEEAGGGEHQGQAVGIWLGASRDSPPSCAEDSAWGKNPEQVAGVSQWGDHGQPLPERRAQDRCVTQEPGSGVWMSKPRLDPGAEGPPGWAQILGKGCSGPQLRKEAWEVEGGGAWGWSAPAKRIWGHQAQGTISLKGCLGLRSSSSQTTVLISPLPRLVPGLLWSQMPA